MKRFVVLGTLACLALADTASAGSFVIDSRGARPRAFRMTAICTGLDNYISPEPYKTSLFNKLGKPIMGHGVGLDLGVQDGKTVLTMSGQTSNERLIIGTADNLDEILPVEGVTLEGYQEWDMLSHAWRLRIKTGSAQLKKFTGKPLDIPASVDRIVANIKAGGKLESESNVKVLVSFLTHLVPGYATNAHHHPLAHYVDEFKKEYVEPMSRGLASLAGPQRQALMDLNEEVLDSARGYLKASTSGQYFVPEERLAVLRAVIEEIAKIK